MATPLLFHCLMQDGAYVELEDEGHGSLITDNSRLGGAGGYKGKLTPGGSIVTGILVTHPSYRSFAKRWD